MGKKGKFIVKQYSNHIDEFGKTLSMIRNRTPKELKSGFIECVVLFLLGIHAFLTFVNVLVFLLRLITFWIRTDDDHIYIESSILLILGGLGALHIWPNWIQQDGALSGILKVLVCWILIDIIPVLFRIVLLNQYRSLVGWSPVSINRTLLLLCLNFLEIALCFSALYLSSQSIGVSGSSGGSIIVCSLQSLYFSIVTITTLGYGDFYPIGPWGQRLAILEVLAGFLFVVVIFGHVVQFTKKKTSVDNGGMDGDNEVGNGSENDTEPANG